MIIKPIQGSILAILAVSLTSLVGCSTTPPKSLMNIQAGEHFVLSQAVTLPAGKVRSYIQFGQLSGGGFNSTEKHCRIELYALPDKPTTIQPERFLIERVNTGEEMIAQNDVAIQIAQNQYASVQTDVMPNMALAYGQSERPETMDLVHLYLKSDTQPNVYRLTCAGSLSNGSNLFDAERSARPQREDVNRILGSVGSIQP